MSTDAASDTTDQQEAPVGDLDSDPQVDVTPADADPSPEAQLVPEEVDATEPFFTSEWVISTFNAVSRYGFIVSFDGADNALVKTRDDRDEYITVPVSSLSHSEAGHR